MPALKNPKHEAFARNVGIKGMSAAEAYREVYDCADSTAESEGPRFCKNPQISTRISHFREIAAQRAAQKDLLTVEEKRGICAEIARGGENKDRLTAIKVDNDLAVEGAEAGAQSELAQALAMIRTVTHG
jgi:hypothetical protein